MIARSLLYLLWALTSTALVGTLVLHQYARLSCHWNWSSRSTNHATTNAHTNAEQGSFMRMVVIADPQMEGDAKIARLGKRALVDLAFNDAYMRHIYRSMMSPSWPSLPWRSLSAYFAQDGSLAATSVPTHVSILGDLFSSQWIDDQEFGVRLRRYRSIFPDPAYSNCDSNSSHNGSSCSARCTNALTNAPAPIMINVTGNHDIGYGYDISQARLERWEQAFGKSNFVSSIVVPSAHKSSSSSALDAAQEHRLHLVVLNTMLLDGPSSDENLRSQTWQFMNEAAAIKDQNPKDTVVLLTHIPFHKEKGICVDAPDIRVHWDNTIIEQTMLTPNTTNWILDHLKPDFVLNGHDHYGCDVTHLQEWDEVHGQMSWRAQATTDFHSNSIQQGQQGQQGEQKDQISVREVTQRSMMAEFGGFAGLFEARWSPMSPSGETSEGRVEFHYTACGFYKDLYVWIVIVADLVVIGAWCLVALYGILLSSMITTSTARLARHSHLHHHSAKKPKML